MAATRILTILVLLVSALRGVPSWAAERGDWPARLSDAGTAMEYWDLTARLESGHFVFARFLITNEGPGSHTAAGIGTLVEPDGRVVPFRYGRRQGEWTLSPDRLLIDIASLTLDMTRQPRHFEMDSDKRGIKIHLDFPTTGPPLGSQPPGSPPHHLDVLEVSAPISGSVWVQGMAAPVKTRGLVTLSHAWMEQSESDYVLRQVEVIVQRPELAVYATDFTAPDGKRRSWLAARRGTEVVYRSEALAVSIEGSAGRPRLGYRVPAKVSMRNPQATVAAATGRELLRLDPTEVIPQPFRFLLSLKMQPERITNEASCRVAIPDAKGGPLEVESPCFVVTTYLNPMSDESP